MQKNTGSRKSGISPKPKFTYKETREIAVIDEEIEKLENRLREITSEMENNWSDHIKIKELTEKHTKLQQELSLKMQRWVYLYEKAEQIKTFNNNK